MKILWRIFAWGCCVGLLFLCLISVAAHGGRFNARLDLLTHFAPLYLGAAVIGLFVSPWLGRVRRTIAATLALSSIVASGALMAPELLAVDRSLPAPSGPADLKIIQFNALAANRVKEGAAAWLLSQNADIIVIEEPGGLERLVARGGYNRAQGSPTTAILARESPARANLVDWSLTRIPSPATIVTFVDARGAYAVVGTKRGWPNDEQAVATHAAYLRRVVRSFGPETTIVVGDFNSTPWSFDRRREDESMGLVRRTRALASWPADRVSHNRFSALFPVLPIDHVYAGVGWRTVSVERGPRLGSDHYPIIVTLAPAGADGRLPPAREDGDARLATTPYIRPARD